MSKACRYCDEVPDPEDLCYDEEEPNHLLPSGVCYRCDNYDPSDAEMGLEGEPPMSIDELHARAWETKEALRHGR